MSSCCSFAEHTQRASHTQTTVGGNAASGLFVEQNDVGLDHFSEQDGILLASLQLLHAGHQASWIVVDGGPGWEISRPGANAFWSIFVEQFSNNSSRYEHAAKEFRKQVNLAD